MPPKSIFRQPGAQHFQVVHRSQRDPLIHDAEASKHVLKHIQRGNQAKGKSRADLEHLISPSDLAHDADRANIGEATLYGIYYDDTNYDYMQHLRPVGLQEDGVESVLLEAPAKGKGKARGSLELLDLPEDTLPSKTELPRNYESQQEIPSSIAGFQPDMDPHLRQALEALEDDAFVDDDIDDDFFGALVKDGERGMDDEVSFEFREEGVADRGGEDHDPLSNAEASAEDAHDGWEARFARFKQTHKPDYDGEDSGMEDGSEGGDTIGALPHVSVIGGKKRRKGTSDASGYSMSSSSMWRNENLTILDERFDQMQREYDSSDEEDEDASTSDLDEAPDLIASRADFQSMMDEFLDDFEVIAGKMRPVLPGYTGMDKLDTIRKGLGTVNLRDSDAQDDEKDDMLMPLDIDEKQDRWDVETILTTYSNLENHPRLIRARTNKPVPQIRLDPKTGLPSVAEQSVQQVSRGPIDPSDSSATSDDECNRPMRHTISRNKNETSEEKRARKQAVKTERQARRTEKKSTKEQFTKEARKQAQSLANKEQTKMRKL